MIWQGNKANPADNYELTVIENDYGVTWMVDQTELGIHIEGYVLFLYEAMQAAQKEYGRLRVFLELGMN